MRLRIGDEAPAFEARDLSDKEFAMKPPYPGPRLLSFLRYASCPMCLLRIDELVRNAPALEAAGIDVTVVMHSPPARIARHVRRALPFRVIADPTRRLYRLYRLEASLARFLVSSLRPSFYVRWVRATARGYLGGRVDGELARLPADFLISASGSIEMAHYGGDIGDHARIEEVIRIRRETASPGAGPRIGSGAPS